PNRASALRGRAVVQPCWPSALRSSRRCTLSTGPISSFVGDYLRPAFVERQRWCVGLQRCRLAWKWSRAAPFAGTELIAQAEPLRHAREVPANSCPHFQVVLLDHPG